MTKEDIKKQLDELGVDYSSTTKKSELEKIFKEAKTSYEKDEENVIEEKPVEEKQYFKGVEVIEIKERNVNGTIHYHVFTINGFSEYTTYDELTQSLIKR